jgi:hypothetical protein
VEAVPRPQPADLAALAWRAGVGRRWGWLADYGVGKALRRVDGTRIVEGWEARLLRRIALQLAVWGIAAEFKVWRRAYLWITACGQLTLTGYTSSRIDAGDQGGLHL